MVSVQEAIEIINSRVKPTSKTQQIPIAESLGYVLAEDLVSNITMPPFRQSAMDGYALCLHHKLVYQLVGEVKAGDSNEPVLNPGEAVRIFTGAPVPDTANAVVIQEVVENQGDAVTLNDKPKEGANIRPKGEQIQSGDLALEAGTFINPATVGFLATLGIPKIQVFKKPRIVIIVTGNELVSPGKPLNHGEIYESNGLMLQAALANFGHHDVEIQKLSDDYQATEACFKVALQNYDLVLVSGGISVGDYDFVYAAMQANGVEQLFYKVNQKPGKPLFFGLTDDCLVFGLPGNPASSLNCFYLYVLQALHRGQGLPGDALMQLELPLAETFVKKGDRAQFLKAHIVNNQVEVLDGQASSMIHSFSKANAVVLLNESQEIYAAGTRVTAYLIKH